MCDCHEFTSPESCPGTIPLASAGRDGSPARCGSARVRSRCHQRGDPPSPAPRGPRRREAAGWGPRSLGQSRSSPARNLLGERLLSSGRGQRPAPCFCQNVPAGFVPRKRAGVRARGLWCQGSLGVLSPCPMYPTARSRTGELQGTQSHRAAQSNIPVTLSAKPSVPKQDSANLSGGSFVKGRQLTPLPACLASPARAPAHVDLGSTAWVCGWLVLQGMKRWGGRTYPPQVHESMSPDPGRRQLPRGD